MRVWVVAATVVSIAGCAVAQDRVEVTPTDVKRFIDPTTLINGIEYTFETSFLPEDTKSYQHIVRPTWALAHWTALWAEIPYTHFSFPDSDAPSGVGDITVGWAAILHEDLENRFTTSVYGVEVVAPTGRAEDDTGTDRWVVIPLGAIALNPTDLFPVYFTGRYAHSLGGSGAPPVRSLEITVETAHILPKGFYVSAIPTFFLDFEQDVNVFSLGVGVGRALTQNFAWAAGYIEHVVGSQTFSRGFSIALSFIWGDEKLARDAPNTGSSALQALAF